MAWLAFVLQFLPQLLQLIVQVQQQFPQDAGSEKKARVTMHAEALVAASGLSPAQQQAAFALVSPYVDAAVAAKHDEGWTAPGAS